jgi:RNA polymerase sigma-70 factor (ECF subfamily)
VGPDSDDADLLAAVAAEHLEALRILHARHAPWIRLRLARRCADPDVVNDALQDTFVAVWRGAGKYRPGKGDAAAWLWTIAIRRLISILRSRGSGWIGDGHALDDTHPAAGTAESAEEIVLLGVEHGHLGVAIARLSPELRAAIQATVLDGLSTREAAHLLGIPEGTVKTRVMRAKARLREELA